MARKWEYRHVFLRINLPKRTHLETLLPGYQRDSMVTGAKMRYWQVCLEQELNKLGEEGWELVSIDDSLRKGNTEDGYALFKRPLNGLIHRS